MVVAGRSTHVDDDVYERRRLRDLPVETRRRCRGGHLRQVDNKVPHGPEEVVLVHYRAA